MVFDVDVSPANVHIDQYLFDHRCREVLVDRPSDFEVVSLESFHSISSLLLCQS